MGTSGQARVAAPLAVMPCVVEVARLQRKLAPSNFLIATCHAESSQGPCTSRCQRGNRMVCIQIWPRKTKIAPGFITAPALSKAGGIAIGNQITLRV